VVQVVQRVWIEHCPLLTIGIQSAFARHIFTLQLSAVALSPPITGPASLGMITALNDGMCLADMHCGGVLISCSMGKQRRRD
jgi:hypothetical protein